MIRNALTVIGFLGIMLMGIGCKSTQPHPPLEVRIIPNAFEQGNSSISASLEDTGHFHLVVENISDSPVDLVMDNNFFSVSFSIVILNIEESAGIFDYVPRKLGNNRGVIYATLNPTDQIVLDVHVDELVLKPLDRELAVSGNDYEHVRIVAVATFFPGEGISERAYSGTLISEPLECIMELP